MPKGRTSYPIGRDPVTGRLSEIVTRTDGTIEYRALHGKALGLAMARRSRKHRRSAKRQPDWTAEEERAQRELEANRRRIERGQR